MELLGLQGGSKAEEVRLLDQVHPQNPEKEEGRPDDKENEEEEVTREGKEE